MDKPAYKWVLGQFKFRSQIKKKKQKLNLTRYKETNTNGL